LYQGWALAVAEKLRDLSGSEQNHPSAAKAGAFPLGLLARINPCPFKTASELCFSAASLAVPHSLRLQHLALVAAEKLGKRGNFTAAGTAGAEARLILLALSARLNSLLKMREERAKRARRTWQGLKRLRKNSLSGVKAPKNRAAGVKTPRVGGPYRHD
jgi:hypothetical protein